MFTAHRSTHNPLITPDTDHTWETEGAFNGCPVIVDNKIVCVYRAQGTPDANDVNGLQLSIIGITESSDGTIFDNHKKFIVPENEWEKYGCEDPRVVYLEGKYYIFYTALSTYPFNAKGIKLAVAVSHDMQSISEKHPVTPFNAKAMALFHEKINGKYYAILTVNTDMPPEKICIAEFDEISQIWSEEYWNEWYKDFNKHALELGRDFNDQVEVGAPPLKTEAGWLVIYSHIQNYFSATKVFGIEAVLLDLNDPTKIIGRTEWPFIIPEAVYETYGKVPNVVFPSGAYIKDGMVEIYYGASDTTTCRAAIRLDKLLAALRPESKYKIFTRAENNPIIKPTPGRDWEANGTLNPAAVDLEGKIHILYRAMSNVNTSTIGHAVSSDGIHIDSRDDVPVYIPRADFEQKHSNPGGNSGCEDPRAIVLEDKVIITYTAYDGVQPPHVAMSYISAEDFCSGKWNWSQPLKMNIANVDDKDASLFPKKHEGNYLLLHRINQRVCIQSLDLLSGMIDSAIELFGPRNGMWDGLKVGCAAPPILTDLGWLLLYHGVAKNGVYMVGAALLDKEDPTSVIARSSYPIFVPEMEYELNGVVNNVVFPCGAVLRGERLYLYYGGGDKVVGVATANLNDLLETLQWK